VKKIIFLCAVFASLSSAHSISESIDKSDILEISLNEVQRGHENTESKTQKLKAFLTIWSPGFFSWNSILENSDVFKLGLNEGKADLVTATISGEEIIRLRESGYNKNKNHRDLKNTTPDLLLDVYKGLRPSEKSRISSICFKVTSESCKHAYKTIDVIGLPFNTPERFVFIGKDGMKIDVSVTLKTD